MEERQQTPEYEEHNATLDPDPAPEAMSDSELQERILEDSGMNSFQKFCARMDDAKWALAQRVTGAILGAIAGVALFWEGLTGREESGFSISLIVAVVIAMLVPNIIEKQSARRIPKLRIALVIGLAAVIVAYFIYMALTTGFSAAA